MGGRGGGKKPAVSYVKPPEPAFLRRIKEQMGYKEGPDVDTKRQENPDCETGDLKDRDDEMPTVVVLKEGDLTQEEAKEMGAFEEKSEEEKSGKITFRKPTKRPAETDDSATAKKKPVSTAKKVNDKKLLSFDNEDEDD